MNSNFSLPVNSYCLVLPSDQTLLDADVSLNQVILILCLWMLDYQHFRICLDPLFNNFQSIPLNQFMCWDFIVYCTTSLRIIWYSTIYVWETSSVIHISFGSIVSFRRVSALMHHSLCKKLLKIYHAPDIKPAIGYLQRNMREFLGRTIFHALY